MTGHALTASRSHARPTLAARLVSRFRGHDDLPEPPASGPPAPPPAPVPLLVPFPGPHGPLVRDSAGIRPATAGEIAATPESEPWWGLTELDIPPVHHRRYVPDPLGQFPPAVTAPDPGPLADLGTCLIFRATVHAVFVRQEQARGFRAPEIPWHERYAGLYRARTGLPVIGGFGIADAARQAHEEAREALAADVRGRIDRITAPVECETETEEVAA